MDNGLTVPEPRKGTEPRVLYGAAGPGLHTHTHTPHTPHTPHTRLLSFSDKGLFSVYLMFLREVTENSMFLCFIITLMTSSSLFFPEKMVTNLLKFSCDSLLL
jgi:hypothetical protein